MLVYAGCSALTEAQCHLPGTTPGRTPQGTLQRETYAAASDFFDRSLSPAGVRALLDRAEAFTRIGVSRGGGGGSDRADRARRGDQPGRPGPRRPSSTAAPGCSPSTSAPGAPGRRAPPSSTG